MKIEDFIKDVFRLTNDDVVAEIVAACEYEHMKKGAFLAKQGEIQNKIYIQEKGIFRCFFDDLNGNEITDNYCRYRGGVALATSSLAEMAPAEGYIQTCIDGDYVSIQTEKLRELIVSYPEVCKIYCEMLSSSLADQWRMRRILMNHSPEERYKLFREKYADIEKDLRQMDIATFLGMTPVSLSRIRKRISVQQSVEE